MGTSLLYHLTNKGMTNVVLLERGDLASGSTGDSAAIVRQHYSNEVSIHLVKKSLELFQSFRDELGTDVFTPSGWMFLVPAGVSAMFDENMERLKRLGVRTWEVSVEEASRQLPGLNVEGIGRVAYEPDSGYADARGTANAFGLRAKERGAEVNTDTPATGIEKVSGRVRRVSTPRGEIETEVVVNAAGPWARQVGEWVGLNLPLRISREQDIVVRPPSGVPAAGMAVSNMVDRTYHRPEPGGLLLVGTGHPKPNDPADPDSYSREADAEFVRETSGLLAHRFPAMADATVVASWAGLYTITPDWSMIVDRAPGLDGVYLAVGGSGHSFKLAPAIGLCLAELIVDGKATTVDISPLRVSRFDERAPLLSTYGGNRG